EAAHRWTPPRAARGHRFPGLPPAQAPAAGDDRPRGIHRPRSGRAGNHFADYHWSSDSRVDRIFRRTDERRHFHGSVDGQHSRAYARGARRRLRPRAPLQRRPRRNACRGRGGSAARRSLGAARGRGARRPACRRRDRRAGGARRVFRADDARRSGCVRVMTGDLPFVTEAVGERGADEPALIVDVEGFEGPLDLLLTLARQQKVDLAKISILALADQYLVFIEHARRLRLELAADYLVMAAWLAYLKSRLLLPETDGSPGPSAEDMATSLALRLKRLEAIRNVAEELMARPQLDRDVFARGN